jgi:exopolysaccharide biosynthesis polyprenyl glycosylphosphotransferase
MTVATEHLRSVRQPADGARAAAVVRLRPEANRLRWLGPGLLVSFDAVALAGALLVSGATRSFGVAYAVVALAALFFSHGYRVRITLRALDATPWLLGRLAIPMVLLAPVALILGSTSTLIRVGLIAMPFVVAGRVTSYALVRWQRRSGRLLEPTVILGAGVIGSELAATFRHYPEYGIRPIGFLDQVSATDSLPLLGDMDSLERLLERGEVRRVVVAFGPARESELVGVLRLAVRHNVEVHIVPRFFDCGVSPEGPDTDDVRGIPLYRVRRAALRARAWWFKRVLDIVAASFAIVLTAPLFLLGAVLAKRSSPGPMLFRQRRVGQDGREFEILKFRTLPVDHVDDRWNADGSEYRSRSARFLRRTSLDELPQLWNILRGDMSLVGPRPERGYLVEKFSTDVAGYRDRHRLPVGLTGWAQVNGLRGDTSLDERARFDNQYIEHWSLWRDLVILARTLAAVVRGTRQPGE